MSKLGEAWRELRVAYQKEKATGKFKMDPQSKRVLIIGAVSAMGIPALGLVTAILHLSPVMVGIPGLVLLGVGYWAAKWMGDPEKNKDHPLNHYPEAMEEEKFLPRGLRQPKRKWEEARRRHEEDGDSSG